MRKFVAHLWKAIGGGVLGILILFSCTTLTSQNAGVQQKVPIKYPKVLVEAYIRTWPLGSTVEDMKKGVYWKAENIKGNYLTDLIIAFALIRDGSSIYIKDMEPDPANPGAPVFSTLWDEVKEVKQKYPHLRVSISVGGYGADGFSDMAIDPKLRSEFVKNVLSWLEKYNLDGVDIDWEYPVGPDWGLPIKTRPEDKDSYVWLLQDLRTALNALGSKTGKVYTLSVAVPASTWFVQKLDVVAISQIVDSMKLMSYDYYGSWSATTGHTANLYNNPADPAWGGWSTDQAVQAYLTAGVPANKIVLGAAFYGRGWKGVPEGETNGLFQKYKEATYLDGISYGDIKKLLNSSRNFVRYWDDVAKAPFIYNGDEFITYSDPQSLQELAQYAEKYGCKGVMYWEYGHDIEGELLESLAQPFIK
ncbi:glycoside hydrolase family 18 protein [Treponema sp. J25]|uniref:glycoside hydrolase family 18 protein n=1 Tax=Treponema sp. J25 TaxID=2094121 RepID=UPI001052AF70|nr:glycoside hydrolase family 18 protein [Treponema sp. J25]TCW60793.1 hypothetical protein C5O22_09630 [Treponema sp. J25]